MIAKKRLIHSNLPRALSTGAVALLALAFAAPFAGAQGNEAEVQQQIDQMMEAMQNSGVPADQLRQVEAMMQGMAEQGIAQMDNEDKQAQLEFEARTAGLGSADVSVDGERYQMRVTKCEMDDRFEGAFAIEAQKGPDREEGHLQVSGAGRVNNSYVYFQINGWLYESNITKFDFDGQTLEWKGMVLGRSHESTPLAVSLTCRQ